jgi:paraquat-inducible protein B
VIRGEVEKGLRVRQVPQGVTGLSYLELDYADPTSNPPLAFEWNPEHVYVPFGAQHREPQSSAARRS